MEKPGPIAHFEGFDADFRTQELRKRGVRVKLPQQSFKILQMLLARPGELVTREELRQALWPGDAFVDFDHGLNNSIARLRDALGDSADTPLYVETLPRLGYRFIGDFDVAPAAPSPVAPSVSTREILRPAGVLACHRADDRSRLPDVRPGCAPRRRHGRELGRLSEAYRLADSRNGGRDRRRRRVDDNSRGRHRQRHPTGRAALSRTRRKEDGTRRRPRAGRSSRARSSPTASSG